MKITKRQLRRIIRESLLAETTSHEREAGLPSEFVEDNWLPWLAERGLGAEDLDDLARFTGAPDRSWLPAAPPADGMDGPADLELWARNKKTGIKESKIKITKRQIRRIIREAMDAVNIETGEVIDFGEDSMSGLPDAALPDLVKRLGLKMGSDGQLSNIDFQKLEDETVGKQGRRESKRKSAQMTADRERLNIDNLLDRLDDWARTAADEWQRDNRGGSIEDVAFDLADSAEYSFEPDEWSELMYHFDDSQTAIRDYIIGSM